MKSKPNYVGQYAQNSFKLLEAIIERKPKHEIQEHYLRTRLSLEFLGNDAKLKSPPIRRYKSLYGTMKIFEGKDQKGELPLEPEKEIAFEQMPS